FFQRTLRLTDEDAPSARCVAHADSPEGSPDRDGRHRRQRTHPAPERPDERFVDCRRPADERHAEGSWAGSNGQSHLEGGAPFGLEPCSSRSTVPSGSAYGEELDAFTVQAQFEIVGLTRRSCQLELDQILAVEREMPSNSGSTSRAQWELFELIVLR